MIDRCKLGKGVRIAQPDLVNLYQCEIGDGTMIGPFVEIQKGAVIGKKCKIESHTFIPEGVTIEDEVFVGHGVVFINDKDPKAIGPWKLSRTHVKRSVSIGSNVTIMPVVIGEGALIGAGSVVTKDVSPGIVVAGNPAKVLRERRPCAEREAKGG